jgi:XTP/dITP diphosphohydrolase
VPIPDRLAIATRNPGKVREILKIFEGLPVRFLTFRDRPEWPEVEETGQTYLENALLKARAVAGATGLAALADDSGIEVDALGGGPGPRSARFDGPGATDASNLERLIREIGAVPSAGRTARYRCVAACAWPGGDHTWAEATCEGAITTEPRGSGGFGYDPVFVPSGGTRTMAELSPEEKNAISHRGKAFRALRDRLELRN